MFYVIERQTVRDITKFLEYICFRNTFASSTHKVWGKVTINVFQLWKNREKNYCY